MIPANPMTDSWIPDTCHNVPLRHYFVGYSNFVINYQKFKIIERVIWENTLSL